MTEIVRIELVDHLNDAYDGTKLEFELNDDKNTFLIKLYTANGIQEFGCDYDNLFYNIKLIIKLWKEK